MPRVSHSLIQRAARESRFLPLLLRECRDLESARNELRWLKEHTTKVRSKSRIGRVPHLRLNSLRNQDVHLLQRGENNKNGLLWSFVNRRARGEPLQYILGDQPFGDLTILCNKHALIPRSETETCTQMLGEFLRHHYLHTTTIANGSPLRVLDLCTGTGCISLLLHQILRSTDENWHLLHTVDTPKLQIMGLDISKLALQLAEDNLKHNISLRNLKMSARDEIVFGLGDVLHLGQDSQISSPNTNRHSIRKSLSDILGKATRGMVDVVDTWDVVVSNPPYISPLNYAAGGTTSRGVRNHEPKLALVPPDSDSSNAYDLTDNTQADQFYHQILQIGMAVDARIIVMEVGDREQADRVRCIAWNMLQSERYDYAVEVWDDDAVISSIRCRGDQQTRSHRASTEVHQNRAVVVWRSDWVAFRRLKEI